MRMPENNGGLAPAHSRYRALLDVSAALVEQPTVKAVLHSLREVLSSSVRLHGTDLYLLDSDRESLHLLEFDRGNERARSQLGFEGRASRARAALSIALPIYSPKSLCEIVPQKKSSIQLLGTTWGAVSSNRNLSAHATSGRKSS